MYALGIDLGTTFTAAATWRNGHAETASLGSRAAAIPSVVLLREDETFMTGEGASRRGLTEPQRVAREFKRRLGDTTPIMLGGVPYSAEKLMARLLRSVVDEVAKREGGAPASICVCHPANWGPYKTDLLLQAVRVANIEEPVSFTTEPEAAAVFYAQQQRIEPGSIVAVYDLGGGTFDAAVLRKTPIGFEILGQPEGIERLGGIDFDAAVFSHVARAIGGKLDELDEDDPTTIAAVARLREECIHAKEGLSADTDVSIPVLLPNLSTEVRLTRAELEAMVRPALYDSIEALKRALRSANVTPEQLHSVLLVGGSSRMPVVAQLVGAELGRPVAVDAHPKHAVALGAAWLASGRIAPAAAPRAAGRAEAAGSAPASPAGAAPVLPAGVPPGPASRPLSPGPVVPVPPPAGGPGTRPPAAPAPAATARASAAIPTPAQTPAGPAGPGSTPTVVGSVYGGAPPMPPAPPAPPGPPVGTPGGAKRSMPLLVALGALLAVLVGGGVALALTSGGDDDPGATGTPDPTGGATPTATEGSNLPPDEQCTDAIKSNRRWVCLTSATISNGELRIEYEFGDNGTPFNINGGFHLHIYGSNADGSQPPEEIMGSQAGSQRGQWYIEDQQPSVHAAGTNQYQTVAEYDKVCARIANRTHALVKDNSDTGTYHTGNCVPLERT